MKLCSETEVGWTDGRMVDCLGRWLVERLHLVVGTKVGRLTVGWWMMITLLTRGAAGAFNPLSQNGPARVEIEISRLEVASKEGALEERERCWGGLKGYQVISQIKDDT